MQRNSFLVPKLVVNVVSKQRQADESLRFNSSDLMDSAVDFATENKILPSFCEGCLQLGLEIPRRAKEVLRNLETKKSEQLDATRRLMEISEEVNVELVIFKTFRDFGYTPDDIDVLLRRKEDLSKLRDILLREGYRILKVGTPEIVFRKLTENTYVDLDIHTELAVGYLTLFEHRSIWKNLDYKRLGRDLTVPILNKEYEIVREAAYSLLKDFSLSTSGFLLSLQTFSDLDLDSVRKIAREQNLLFPLEIFMVSFYISAHKLLGSVGKNKGSYEIGHPFKWTLKLLVADMERKFQLPYSYPLPLAGLSYLSKVWLEMSTKGNPRALFQLLSNPASKGVGSFYSYLGRRVSHRSNHQKVR